MSDQRQALEKIMILCSQSTLYTRRTQQINDVAMRGLGMTQNQRDERHLKIIDANGDCALRTKYEARAKARDARALIGGIAP